MRTLIVGAAAAGIAALSVLAPAYSQERASLPSQEAMVDCIRRAAPQLVEGTLWDARDFVRLHQGGINYYTQEALAVGKRCEEQLRKQAALAPVKN